ncbi:MAG: fumarate hydratase [Solobacterium sp.]|nr:fumarate hydratase [Solobacterium sp.]
MREIDVKLVEDKVFEECGRIAVQYDPGILEGFRKAYEEETDERSRAAVKMLLENAEIAEKERIPICQDTGLVIVWLKVGQEVHFVNGSLYEAVHNGVRRSYTENCLRASAVDDPLFDRKNTKDNTPAVIYTEITEGDRVVIELMAKGFGSENKSAVKMLTPAEGEEGVRAFVLDTIRNAGPNACPPFIVGVGIGGTFDSCAVLSKRALLRPLHEGNSDPRYRKLEDELLEAANRLKVGPMGFHGKTTALKVQIEYAPTHIAGLPCAVNMCCHVCRHAKAVI